MKRIIIIQMLFSAVLGVYAQHDLEKGLEAITLPAVKGQLEFLASDWTRGRAVGTEGAYMAADYIASMFQVYGIEPFGDMESEIPSRRERMQGMRPHVYRSYFQNFSLLEYSPGEEQHLAVNSSQGKNRRSVHFQYKTDFNVQTGTVGQSGEASVVFVGYGFKDGEGDYNDFSDVDLKGKIALVLNGFPGHRDSSSVAFEKFAPEGRYARYYLERNKREMLEKSGAIAIIRVNPEAEPAMAWAANSVYPARGEYYEADSPLRSYYDTRMTLPGDSLKSEIPVFSVTSRVSGELLKGAGIDLSAFEERVASEMTPASTLLHGTSVSFQTQVNSKIVKARNVLGVIEGEKTDEYVVVGGHYDHLGKWDGWIWNGADDNASGTVGVMTIGKAFKAMGQKPEKTIIFAAWTGEEKGLWGSRYFVQDALRKEMNIVLNLNYDMIARSTKEDTLKNQASMVYTRARAGIEDLTRKNLEDFDIPLDLTYRPSAQPGGGSDHAPFAQNNIPVFYFMAAMHPDYHLPSDELRKINWEKMVSIIKIGFLNTWELANSDEYLKQVEIEKLGN